MYTNVATGLTAMARNAEYKPVWVNDSNQLSADMAANRCGPGHFNRFPIFRIHVAINALTTGFVRLWLYDTAVLTPVDIPYKAFKEGSTYDMHVSKYTLVNASGVEIVDKDADFVIFGHMANSLPMSL